MPTKKDSIERVTDNRVMTLAYELYGENPTDAQLAELEGEVSCSIEKLRKSTIPPPPEAAPRYSTDPEQEEILRKLAHGDTTLMDAWARDMDPDICIRPREDAGEEL